MRKGLTFDDVLLIPKFNPISSRKDVDTSVELTESIKLKIPIVSANMDTITGSKMAKEMNRLGGLGILHRFMSVEENVEQFKECGCLVGISVGVSDGELKRAKALVKAGAKIVCIDVAHGDSKAVNRMYTDLYLEFGGEVYFIVGNIATASGIIPKIDAMKVGIGAGSVCTTRIKTGCGVPQLTAIMDCAKVARKSGTKIIADGGIRYPGDVVKAIAAGADLVMIGGMLAGTTESEGGTTYRGMASKPAQEGYKGQMDDWKTSEGISIDVPEAGPVEGIINDIMGGLRSGMTYCGASNLEMLRKNAEFIKVTDNGVREGFPHKLGIKGELKDGA